MHYKFELTRFRGHSRRDKIHFASYGAFNFIDENTLIAGHKYINNDSYHDVKCLNLNLLKDYTYNKPQWVPLFEETFYNPVVRNNILFFESRSGLEYKRPSEIFKYELKDFYIEPSYASPVMLMKGL